ncbi:MAG TPA: DUF2939 domain-containing protein [Acetobacteraceae bacterium]|jgi:hypothetical protein|nr:DUF2939 domain-containing protein [Acetobacteraceae bacterium]
MRARWPLLATVLSLGVAYVAYPYLALYRLGSAVKSADAATLEALVDWPAVREGIKEDVCDLAAENSSPTAGANLPPFGASFVRGITSASIDQTVTPQALLAVAASEPAHPTPRGADIHINWAFFDSPTTFMVSLQSPGQADPIKLEMDLRHGAWRVYRVWLPADLLEARART